MHKHTIMAVAILSMLPQISLAQETTETPSEETITTEQPAAETATEEVAATEQPVTPQATDEQQVPMIPGPPVQPAEEKLTETKPTIELEVTAETETIKPTEKSEEVSEPVPAPSLMKAPAPIEEEPIVIPEEPEMQAPAGIDTVSLENPQGNWLYKRIWWERAEERYEKIRLLVDAVWESRTIFFVKRNELDRNVLDPFYLNVGIGQGELQIILSELVDFFEKHREQQGDLSEQERSLYDTIATEEEALKQLKQDVESVANLDHAIDDALGTLMNQINRVRQYERQAWENFKEIAHILNDTKARELYYMIEGAARNIKNISSYVEQDFFNHFSKLIEETTQHINRIQNQIESLKEKGVSFKRQTELLEQKQEQPEEEEEEEVAPKPKLSWFGWIMSGLSSVSDFIFSIIRMPYDLIFGK
jgi:hypothetical protein